MNTQRICFSFSGLLALFLLLPPSGFSQQLNCTITVNYEAISTTNKDLLSTFQDDIQRYFDGYQWGQDSEFSVDCNIQIFFESVVGENRYSAQAFIGSSRDLLNRDEQTPMVRIKDDNWQFQYLQSRPLNHNPFTFHELTSFLDFYAYIILGYDYDSYESLGGTKWFQNAADVANLGRSSGQKGWQNATGGYSRTQLIDDILNPTLSNVRLAGYVYHFSGLDSLRINPSSARTRMLEALEGIGQARKKADPRNLSMRVFFDAKYLEIAKVFSNYPDPSIFVRLGEIDPTHINTYEQERAKRE